MSYELLLQAGLVELLFYLNKVTQEKISIIKDALNITQHSLYASIEKLDEHGFIKDNKQPTQRIIQITKKGEVLAEKLSYLFDETKEIIVIDKMIVEDFKKILKQEGMPTWQELIRQIIYQQWRGYKKKYPLIFKSE